MERSSIQADRYTEVQAVVLVYQIRQLLTVSDSPIPILMGFSEAAYMEDMESDARIPELGPRNNSGHARIGYER